MLDRLEKLPKSVTNSDLNGRDFCFYNNST